MHAARHYSDVFLLEKLRQMRWPHRRVTTLFCNAAPHAPFMMIVDSTIVRLRLPKSAMHMSHA